jgi:hypothetical protein
MMFRSFVRPLFVALSLAFASTAAAPAFADNAGDNAAEHGKGKGRGKHKDHDDNRGKSDDVRKDDEARGKGKDKGKDKEEKFPRDGEKFSKHVDSRLTQAKDKLSGALSKKGMSDAQRAEILKSFDDGAALVRAAVKRAAKDGEVTKEEAKDVRLLVKGLRKQLRDKLPKKEKVAPKGV